MTNPPDGPTPPGGLQETIGKDQPQPIRKALSPADSMRPAEYHHRQQRDVHLHLATGDTAAVVLCDLASTAYYIGGIVEQAIGPAAPWFILAVMLFSYAVRSVYIESCSLFVRGGVYRVVKEAMGGFLAKLSVSALMFDYILTGPISGVSAGQYIIGLMLDTHRLSAQSGTPMLMTARTTRLLVKAGAPSSSPVAITLYFFRQNLIGIHESSDKALKIMIATTIMAVVMLVWCVRHAGRQGPARRTTIAGRRPQSTVR